MTHQVLEEYNSLTTSQTTNRVPKKLLKLLNKYLLTVTFENGENYLIRREILNNGPIFDLKNEKKTLLVQHY